MLFVFAKVLLDDLRDLVKFFLIISLQLFTVCRSLCRLSSHKLDQVFNFGTQILCKFFFCFWNLLLNERPVVTDAFCQILALFLIKFVDSLDLGIDFISCHSYFVLQIFLNFVKFCAHFAQIILVCSQKPFLVFKGVPVLHTNFRVLLQLQSVFTQCFFVAFLHHGELFFEFLQTLWYNIVHFCGLVLDLLVNFVQSYTSFVNFNQLLFWFLETLKGRRLVQKPKKHVSDLLHGEHARLLKSLRFEVIFKFRIFIFKSPLILLIFRFAA